MTERSLGWATTGVGDGILDGYPTARMTQMEYKTLGNGILTESDKFALSRPSGVLCRIASGSAVVDGYFYENTDDIDIPTSIGNGNYEIAIMVNGSASNVTVLWCVGGGTTIAPSTVRLAVVDPTEVYSTPVTKMVLYNITVAASALSLWDDYRPWATTTAQSYGVPTTLGGGSGLGFAYMKKTTQWSVLNNFETAVQSYDVGQGSADGMMTVDTSGGSIYFNGAMGVFAFDAVVMWDINTAGIRQMTLLNRTPASGSGPSTPQDRFYDLTEVRSNGMLATNTSIISQNVVQRYSGIVILKQPTYDISDLPSLRNNAFALQLKQSSGSTRLVNYVSLTLARIG